MPVTPSNIANIALAQMGAQNLPIAIKPADSTQEAIVADLLYDQVIFAILRQNNWDFARKSLTLTLLKTATGAPWSTAQPPPPWEYEYAYPADCVQLRAVAPQPTTTGTPGGGDPNDPAPILFAVAMDDSSMTELKTILSNQASAIGIYTANVTDPTLWESSFTEAVIRMLSSELAYALAGRPDTSKAQLQVAGGFEQMGTQRTM